tara:strand:- start:74619 stop:74957 length:339 start_codon:yes stop_codon:yes gene_type:complete
MSDVPTVRIVDATERISGQAETRFGVPHPVRQLPPDPTAESGEKAPVPEPFKAPEPIRRKFQARLNYDPFERDVFIEILDPETGEVLRRLPAEKVGEDESAYRGGAILNRLA